MSNSSWPHRLQHGGPPCPSPSPGVFPHSCPWISDAIQPSHPLSPSFFAFHVSQHQGLFQGVGCSHWVAKVLELQLQHQSFEWVLRVDFLSDWLIWSPCCPRDSQVSSPAPHLESINALALCLLYGPTHVKTLEKQRTSLLFFYFPSQWSNRNRICLFNYFCFWVKHIWTQTFILPTC